MNRTNLRKALDHYADRHLAATADLWPAIRADIRDSRATIVGDWDDVPAAAPSQALSHERAPRRPALNLSVATLLIIALGLAGFAAVLVPRNNPRPTGGYASGGPAATPTPVATIVEDVAADPPARSAPRLDYVDQYGTPLNVSRSIGDYTVTVTKAYADANQAVVMFTLKGPEGESVAATNGSLSSMNGPALPYLFGEGGIPASEPDSYLMDFDTADLGAQAGNLDLMLELDIARIDPNKMAALDEKGGSTGESSESGKTKYLKANRQLEVVAGPFSLPFSVPVTAEGTRMIEVNQTVEASGIPLTLERVVITRGELRAVLRADPSALAADAWKPLIILKSGGFDSENYDNPHLNSALRRMDDGSWIYSLSTPLPDTAGEWHLSVAGIRPGPVEEAAGMEDKAADGNPKTNPEEWYGPWNFSFTVPPQQ